MTDGGEGGIRTLDALASTPVFETGLFSHSSTSPHGYWRVRARDVAVRGCASTRRLKQPQRAFIGSFPLRPRRPAPKRRALAHSGKVELRFSVRMRSNILN